VGNTKDVFTLKMVCFHVHEFDVHDHVHDSYQHVFLAFILQKSGKRNDQNIQL